MSPPAHNKDLIGIASLALGVVVFSLQDAIIKSISGDYPVTMAIVVRCLVALPLLLFMVHLEVGLGRLLSRNAGVLVLRGLILLVAYTTYFMSLAALPLAEAIALFFTAPLIITMLSGPILGERVSLQAWIAVVVGFIGVLIILRPGSALFEPAALLSLVSATTYALSMVIARRIGVTESATVMAFYQNGVYLLGASLAAVVFSLIGIEQLGHPSLDFLVRPWSSPKSLDLLLMAVCGVIAAFGMFLLTNAYRSAKASLVTVFEYTGMIWGPLWGYLFFSEIPRWSTAAGMILIIGAGIFAVRTAASQSAESRQDPA
jgi:drug/metabolite transporter (DMT)-like permease